MSLQLPVYFASPKLLLEIYFSKYFKALLISHFFPEEDLALLQWHLQIKHHVSNFLWCYKLLYQWTPHNSCFALWTWKSLFRNCVYIENFTSGYCRMFLYIYWIYMCYVFLIFNIWFLIFWIYMCF